MPASKAARCAPPARPAGSDSARGVFPIRYARRGGQLLVMLDCALKQNLNGFNKDHGIGADSRVPELPPFLVLKKRAVCSSKPASSIFFRAPFCALSIHAIAKIRPERPEVELRSMHEAPVFVQEKAHLADLPSRCLFPRGYAPCYLGPISAPLVTKSLKVARLCVPLCAPIG